MPFAQLSAWNAIWDSCAVVVLERHLFGSSSLGMPYVVINAAREAVGTAHGL